MNKEYEDKYKYMSGKAPLNVSEEEYIRRANKEIDEFFMELDDKFNLLHGVAPIEEVGHNPEDIAEMCRMCRTISLIKDYYDKESRKWKIIISIIGGILFSILLSLII